ncbi:MAG: T9SS type A sorting domain-containing protein [Chitinophagales bacterium]
MYKLITVALFLLTQTTRAQNLISNSNFETNGQAYCHGWLDACGNHLDYLCEGQQDSLPCNATHWGATLYNQAAPGAGQWCIGLREFQNLPVSITTVLTGQFKGVFEFKAWMRLDTIGTYGSVIITTRNGIDYTGQHYALGTNPVNPYGWKQLVFRDTIKTLSDTILIQLSKAGNNNWPVPPPSRAFFDMAEFSMVESWTGTEDPSADKAVDFFPNPFSNQLNCKPGSSEPCTLTLCNVLGQAVLQQSGTHLLTLPTESLASGVYMYQLRYPNGLLKTGRLVKP